MEEGWLEFSASGRTKAFPVAHPLGTHTFIIKNYYISRLYNSTLLCAQQPFFLLVRISHPAAYGKCSPDLFSHPQPATDVLVCCSEMGTATSSQATGLGLIVSETWVPTFGFSCCCCFCPFWTADLPLLVWTLLQSRDPLCLVRSPVPTTRHVSGIQGILSQCLNERMAELTSCLKEWMDTQSKLRTFLGRFW